MVTIEVVRRNVQDDGGLGFQGTRKFQLEAGQFCYDDVFLGQVFCLQGQAVADIAANDRFPAGGLHDFA